MAEYVIPDYDTSSFTPSTYAEGTIPADLAQIETAIYGRDVRASIVESLYLVWCNQSELQTQVEANAGEISTLQTWVQDLASSVSDLEKLVSSHTTAISTLQEQVEALQTQVDANTEEIEALLDAPAVTWQSVGDDARAILYASGKIEIRGSGEVTETLSEDFAAAAYPLIDGMIATTFEDGISSICTGFANTIYAYYSASLLTAIPTVVIPETVQFIGYNALFTTRVTYAGTMAQWCEISSEDSSGTATQITSSAFCTIKGATIQVTCADGVLAWNSETEQWEEVTDD